MRRRILALLIALAILAATATSALAGKPPLGYDGRGIPEPQPALNCGKSNTAGYFYTYDWETGVWTQEVCGAAGD